MVKTHRPIAPLDEVTRRRGAALLLDVLRSEGVRYIFGAPSTWHQQIDGKRDGAERFR
jgi:hypothetical protein